MVLLQKLSNISYQIKLFFKFRRTRYDSERAFENFKFKDFFEKTFYDLLLLSRIISCQHHINDIDSEMLNICKTSHIFAFDENSRNRFYKIYHLTLRRSLRQGWRILVFSALTAQAPKRWKSIPHRSSIAEFFK